MSDINSLIEFQNNFAGNLYQAIESVNLELSAIDNLINNVLSQINTTSVENTSSSTNQAAAEVNGIGNVIQNADSQNSVVIDILIEPVVSDPLINTPGPVQVPVVWRSDNLEVFTSTGAQRFEQEIRSADNMLESLSNTQNSIANAASAMGILPQEAASDIAGVQTRLEAMSRRMQEIENNPLNIGSDAANAELEKLREQFNRIGQIQQSLNSAIENMDVSGANDAYLRLSRAVANTEIYIRDNVDAQGQFNQTIEQSTHKTEGLFSGVKKLAGNFLTLENISLVLDISDELNQSVAKINTMNDGVQTTQELMNLVYASTQNARGAFFETVDLVTKFANNAGDAFSGSAEAVAFSNLVQKQMMMAGISTDEAAEAMLQLSQAMGSGVLKGDELSSIFEQAPNLIRNIADYLDVPIDKIQELASEGEITSDIVKNAIFGAADEINANFDAMPVTFEQAVQSFENMALMAFQPALGKLSELTGSEAFQVLMAEASKAFSLISGLAAEVLDRINDIANSEGLQSLISFAAVAFSVLGVIALSVIDIVVGIASVIIDNWQIIATVILGVASALGVYYGKAVLAKGASMALAAAQAVLTAAKIVAVPIYSAFTGSTMAGTAAQWGLNAAMYACPIVWIIMAIIVLISVIAAVCIAIAKFTGVAESGFGVFCGAINVAIALFKNLAFTAANVVLGIWEVLKACAHNIHTAFHNVFCTLESGFYGLLSTALQIVEKICENLNKLPFVEFDYSGIAGSADKYARKSAEAFNDRWEYESITDAFSKGFNTFDTFQDGWISDAFKAGAAWGDGINDKISSKISGIFDKFSPDMPDLNDKFDPSSINPIDSDNIGNMLDDINGNSGDTASNTAQLTDSVSMSAEELRYLREIAEREAINKFTTAEIKITMNNNNAISGNDDIDGFINELEIRTEEAMVRLAEGDHI